MKGREILFYLFRIGIRCRKALCSAAFEHGYESQACKTPAPSPGLLKEAVYEDPMSGQESLWRGEARRCPTVIRGFVHFSAGNAIAKAAS